MTTEVEQQLRALIRRHGEKKVHDALVLMLCAFHQNLCLTDKPAITVGHAQAARDDGGFSIDHGIPDGPGLLRPGLAGRFFKPSIGPFT